MKLPLRDTRFVALFALGLVLVTGVPYAVGHALDLDRESRFRGNLVLEGDMNAYFAFMRQAAEGDWLFRNTLTAEPHEGAFFNLEWLLAGRTARLLGSSLETAFQIQRVFAAILLCFALHALACRLIRDPAVRRIALATILLGGGFGWTLELTPLSELFRRSEFLDLIAGVHPFFWVLFSPHFLIAQAGSIVTFVLYLRAEERGTARDYGLAALALLVVGSMRPYDMAFLATTLTVHLALSGLSEPGVRPRAALPLRLLPVAASLPLFGYYVWLLKIHPVFRWWGSQTVVPPPLPLSLAVSVGLLAFLLPFRLRWLAELRQRPAPQLLVLSAFVSSLGLLYAYPVLPFTLQFVTSLVIPTGLVVAAAFEERIGAAWRAGGLPRASLLALLAINSLTSLHLLHDATRRVLDGEARTEASFVAAAAWLQQNSEPGDVVMASYRNANRIPRHTHAVPVAGYAYATVRFREKLNQTNRVFAPRTSDRARREILQKHEVRFLWFSQADRLRTSWEPALSPFLERAYRNEEVTVYRVLDPRGGRRQGRRGAP